MAKKTSRRLPLPDDVLADRVRPEARDLIALIHDVNPTGLGLDRKETARRYALKSRLQSVLVRRFPEDIGASPEPSEPGIVALRYLPLDLNACHALLTELDDDARSRVQHILDTHDATPQEAKPLTGASSPRLDRKSSPQRDAAPVRTLLAEGAAALEAYDYESARGHFEAALEQSNGARDAARALLSLLVEFMAADDDALAIQDKLDASAFSDGIVRSHLAVAAARQGARARALSLIEERGIKLAPPLVADVLVLLAKNELALGNTLQAKNDLNRAQELVGTHPEFSGLLDALSKVRTVARGPEESEIAHLFANGHMRQAEERADDLLTRFPESDVARKVKRAIEEQKKLDGARTRLEEARGALESGDEVRARSLLRSALSLGLPPKDAAWAEAHLAELEHAEQRRIEETRLAETLRVLETHDLALGLSLYAELSDTSRIRVARQYASPVIGWLDELHAARSGGKVGVTITAILALHEATELVASDPTAALERLTAQDKVLRGFGPAENTRKAAQAALAEQQRRTAQNRVEAARRALADGDANSADRISKDVAEKHLSDDDARAFHDLCARIQIALERNALEALLEQQRRRGDSVAALNTATHLAARSEGAAIKRVAGICSELRAETRRAFSVRVETVNEAAGPEWNCLQDSRIFPKRKWETIVQDPEGGPDDFLFVLPQTMGDWVFIRLIDLQSGQVRKRVTLRTPTQLDMIHSMVHNRRLLLTGRCGAFLEIDVSDWAILQWCSNFLRTSPSSLRNQPEHQILEMTLPDVIIDGITISHDGRFLWVNALYTRRRHDESLRMIHIIEIDGLKPVRDMRIPSGDRVYCQSVGGIDRACMAIVHDGVPRSQQRTSFYDPRGRIWEDAPLDMALDPKSLVGCPDEKHILGITSDPDIPKGNPETAPWGFYVVSGHRSGPLTVIPDIVAVYHNSAITSRELRMSFVLFWTRYKSELIALRENADGLEIAYRVLVPRYSAFAATTDGRCPTLVVIHDDHHEFIRLGKTPPAFKTANDLPPVLFPSLPRSSLHAKHSDCHLPTGAEKTAVDVLEAELLRMGKLRYQDKLRKSMKKNDPDELLALDFALQRVREPSLAGDFSAHVEQLFPDHPRIKLNYARTLANVGRWNDVLTMLDSIDPKSLSNSEAKHLHHLRGAAHMMHNDPNAAIVEFDLGLKYAEGACLIEELLAFCVPTSDSTREWPPEPRATRSWLRCVAAADEALARGDSSAARKALDVTIVWEVFEVQSLARLARTYLDEGESGHTHDAFRKALALLGFCDLVATFNTMHRREMPLPQARLSNEELKEMAGRASRWVEATFGKSQGDR